MRKGTVQADIAETLLELGKTTGKQSAAAVNRTVNPVKIFEAPAMQSDAKAVTGKETTKMPEAAKNITDLDVESLKIKYAGQDKDQLEVMRRRLFKLVREGEEKAIADRRREEEARIKQAAAEAEEKEQARRQAAEAPQDIPKGKERRSIFAARKKQSSQIEIKPSSSKG